MRSYLHRKESIILTAIEIIDELGIHELSSREIARRQKISEGTIFKHFKDKNEILLGVLEHYSKFDSDIVDSIKIRGLGFRDGIAYHLAAYSEYFENYHAISAMQQNMEVLLYNEKLKQKVKHILETQTSFIENLVDKGRKNGEIPDYVNSEYAADIITGLFRAATLKWRMCKYGFPLKDRVLAAMETVLKGLLIT